MINQKLKEVNREIEDNKDQEANLKMIDKRNLINMSK